MMGVNYDPEEFDSIEECLQSMLDDSDYGDLLVICRGDWNSCPQGTTCATCARVIRVRGMTVDDLIEAIKGH